MIGLWSRNCKIEEFEGDDNTDPDFIDEHHDNSASTLLQFYKDVKTFLLALEKSGNPFKDDSDDLYDLETKLIAPIASVQNLKIIQKIGTEQFNEFINSRLLERKIPVSDTNKKNKLHIFFMHTKVRSKKDEQSKSAKDSVSLFSRLFFACQTRDLDMFFAHENQPCPPTLSEKAEIRPAKTKSGVIDCILPHGNYPNECPPVD